MALGGGRAKGRHGGPALPLSRLMLPDPAILLGVQFPEVALFLWPAGRSCSGEPASRVRAAPLPSVGPPVLLQGRSSYVRTANSSAAAASVSRSWSWTRERGKGHPELHGDPANSGGPGI